MVPMLAVHVLAVMGFTVWVGTSLILMFGGFLVAVTSPPELRGVAQLGAGLGIVAGGAVSLAYAFQAFTGSVPAR